MNIIIYKDNAEFGTAEIYFEGNKHRFTAKCPYIPGIYRLYIYSGDGGVLPLGVLIPAGGSLSLDKTVTSYRAETSGEGFYEYGILCEGDSNPLPLRTRQEEPIIKQEPRTPARLDRWLETNRPQSFTEDEVLKMSLTGAVGVLYRYRMGCIELALPARCHENIAPVLAFTRAEEIRGEEYFVLKLDAEGFPRAADEPSTY